MATPDRNERPAPGPGPVDHMALPPSVGSASPPAALRGSIHQLNTEGTRARGNTPNPPPVVAITPPNPPTKGRNRRANHHRERIGAGRRCRTPHQRPQPRVVPRLIAELSLVLPVLPGDIIFTGTTGPAWAPSTNHPAFPTTRRQSSKPGSGADQHTIRNLFVGPPSRRTLRSRSTRAAPGSSLTDSTRRADLTTPPVGGEPVGGGCPSKEGQETYKSACMVSALWGRVSLSAVEEGGPQDVDAY